MAAHANLTVVGGEPSIDMEMLGTAKLWGAESSVFFKANGEDLVLASKLQNLDLQHIPFLRAREEISSVVVDHAVLYYANHDATLDGTEFRAGLTFAGEASTAEGKLPKFMAELQRFFSVHVEKGSISAWAPMDGSDFSLKMGVAGNITFKAADAFSMSFVDPGFSLYRVDSMLFMKLELSGSATLGALFQIALKDMKLNICPEKQAFFLEGPASMTNVKTGVTTEGELEVFLGEGHPDEAIPQPPFAPVGEEIVTKTTPLFADDWRSRVVPVKTGPTLASSNSVPPPAESSPTTMQPTMHPTATPILLPTPQPTIALTTLTPPASAQPTALPTGQPTASPTETPTRSPTATPTSSPTNSPTAAPTAEPTAQPTAQPTEHPTAAEPKPTSSQNVVPETSMSWLFSDEDVPAAHAPLTRHGSSTQAAAEDELDVSALKAKLNAANIRIAALETENAQLAAHHMVLLQAAAWSQESVDEEAQRFYVRLGPMNRTGTAFDAQTAFEAGSATLLFTNKEGTQLPSAAAASLNLPSPFTLPQGATMYLDVGWSADSGLGRAFSRAPFDELPTSYIGMITLDLASDEAATVTGKLMSKGTKPSGCTSLLDKDVMTLVLCDFMMTFRLSSEELVLGIGGTLKMTDSFLDGPPVTLPEIQGQVVVGAEGVTGLLVATTEELLLKDDPDPDYRVTIGPFQIALKVDTAADVPVVVAMKAKVQFNVVSNLMRTALRQCTFDLTPLMDTLEMMSKLTTGVSMVFSIATAPMNEIITNTGEHIEVHSAGVAIHLECSMVDALVGVGLPPLGFMSESGGGLDLSDEKASVALIIPFDFFTTFSLASAPSIGFSASGPTIRETVRFDHFGVQVRPSTKGIELGVSGKASINVRKCDQEAHGYGCVVKGMAEARKAGGFPQHSPAWLEDNWLSVSMSVSGDTSGTISIQFAMIGAWENAFGISDLSFGTVWFRYTVNIPQCSSAISTAAATVGAGAGAAVAACIGGIGLGGQGTLSSMQVELNAYIGIAEPEKIWVSSKATDIGLGGLAGLMLKVAALDSMDWAGELIESMGWWGDLDTVEVSLGTFQGTIGNCPGTAPSPLPPRV